MGREASVDRRRQPPATHRRVTGRVGSPSRESGALRYPTANDRRPQSLDPAEGRRLAPNPSSDEYCPVQVNDPRLGIEERRFPLQKRLVTRYAMQSPQAADENQRRVEGVFDELSATRPDTVSYIVLRLEDDSFVHVSFHDHGDDEVNPITSTAAFARFQEGHTDRRAGAVDQQKATLVGAYITTID